jgi:hypothetical protein
MCPIDIPAAPNFMTNSRFGAFFGLASLMGTQALEALRLFSMEGAKDYTFSLYTVKTRVIVTLNGQVIVYSLPLD